MPLNDIPELDEVDSVLDGLTTPTSLQVFDAMRPYNDRIVTAAAAQRAVNGGGGGGSDLTDHIADPTGAHAATAIAFTPNGSIAATDVQTAIQEVRDEATGGGSEPTYTDAAAYTGNTVSIAPGPSFVELTWDTLGAGAALLDLTDPTRPEVVVEGIYAVTAVLQSEEALTAATGFSAALHLDFLGTDAVCEATAIEESRVDGRILVSLACSYYVPAGGVIMVSVADVATSAKDFKLREAMVQRLS